MTAAGSHASEVVLEIAQKLQSFITSFVKSNGTISANDVRNSTAWEMNGGMNSSILYSTERASTITLAFRLAGLQKTNLKVTNTAPEARHRKVSVWALPAASIR